MGKRAGAALLIDGAGEEAAVDDDDFAGDEGRGLRGEEDGSAGELVGLAEAVHGRAHQKLFTARRALNERAIERRGKDAGSDGVYVDAFLSQLNGEDFS